MATWQFKFFMVLLITTTVGAIYLGLIEYAKSPSWALALALLALGTGCAGTARQMHDVRTDWWRAAILCCVFVIPTGALALVLIARA